MEEILKLAQSRKVPMGCSNSIIAVCIEYSSFHGRSEQESGVVGCACRSTPEVYPPDIWFSRSADITRVVILG